MQQVWDSIEAFDGISGTSKGIVYLRDRSSFYMAWLQERELMEEFNRIKKENTKLKSIIKKK